MRVFVIIFCCFFYSCLLWAELPSGNTTIIGDISISSDTQTMTIDQQSDQAIIEWNSFNIGENNTVTFQQPSTSASALNRVISGNPTTLAGALNANGKVFVVNENGVYFTPTATINAHSFAASTLSLSNENFLNNIFSFNSSNQSSLQSIINKGSITTLDGGFTALLGGAINNEGTINANLGKLGLGAGKEITLDLSGDKFLQVAVPIELATTILDDENNDVKALIQHAGSSNAHTIDIDIGSAKTALNNAVFIPGNLVATTASQENGVITLGGSTAPINVLGNMTAKEGLVNIDAGLISFTGKVDVSGEDSGNANFASIGNIYLDGSIDASSTVAQGGNITLSSSNKIIQTSNSTLDASGTEGGDINISAKNFETSGNIIAAGLNGVGGQLDIEASSKATLYTSNLDASGTSRGGLVRIGGAFQGSNDLTRTTAQEETFINRWGILPSMKNAQFVFINKGAIIDVASSNGDAGTAIIWSDQETTMLGKILATGTIGGSVEISSKDTLRHIGLNDISISAGGHLLLDPKNITIGDVGTSKNWTYQSIIDSSANSAVDLTSFNMANDDQFGMSGVRLSGDGTKLGVLSRLDDGYNDSSNNYPALYLFQFSDTNFSNPTLRGIIGKGYDALSGTHPGSLDFEFPSNDPYPVQFDLDYDGDRLVLGAPIHNAPGKAGSVYTIKFDDTNFTNPTIVGHISETPNAAYSQNLQLLDLFNQGFGGGIALNSDGSRMAVAVLEGIHLISFSDTNFTSPTITRVLWAESSSTPYSYNSTFPITSINYHTLGDNIPYNLNLTDDATALSFTGSENNIVTFSDNNFSNPSLALQFAHDCSSCTGNNNISFDAPAGGNRGVRAHALSGDGRTLLISSNTSGDYIIKAYGFSDTSFSNPTLISSFYALNGADVQKMALSSDGSNLALGYTSGGVELLTSSNYLDGTAYTEDSSSDITISVDALEALLDTNVNVTLQANTDIIINAPITTTGTGTLSLHAGRDVDINKSISTSGNLAIIASDTSANNVVSAQRDSGTGDILAAYESDGTTSISLSASDLDITLNNGSGVSNASMGNIELATITATTGTLQSANFSGSGAAVSDKAHDGTTSATVATTGSVSGLTLVGSDLALVNTAAFTSATIGAAKDATVDYDLSGYLSSTMDVTDTSSTAITESVTAAITGTSSSSSSIENNNVEVTSNDQTEIVENMIGDINKIVPFVSVDAIVGSNMSLQLAREANIQSTPNTEGLGFQSL